MTPELLTMSDGTRLNLRSWPTTATAQGTVLLVHGLGEHIGRYGAVAGVLNAHGWHVVGYDHRGHGLSDGARGAIGHEETLLSDLASVIDAVRRVEPGRLVALGHSMGALVAARFAAEGTNPSSTASWRRHIDTLVLSSPPLHVELSGLRRGLLRALGRVAPNLPMANGLNPEWISRDPAVVQAYQNDERVHDRLTPRLAGFILTAGRFVLECAPRWEVPTLLVYAGSDRCVAPSGSRRFAATAPDAVVTSGEFGPLFHEILNEPEWLDVMAVVTSWLDVHACRRACSGRQQPRDAIGPLETVFAVPISGVEPAGAGFPPAPTCESEDTHHVRIDPESTGQPVRSVRTPAP